MAVKAAKLAGLENLTSFPVINAIMESGFMKHYIAWEVPIGNWWISHD